MENTDKQLFTIGHGNRKIEFFIELLLENNIQMVIDVRSIPYSRFHPQFRQKNLKISLMNANINYLWLGSELGGRPTDSNLYKNGKPDYSAMKLTESFKSGIENVLKLLDKEIKVTLMCSESDQNDCHRKYLIADLFTAKDIKVVHINKYGHIEINLLSFEKDLFD